jgi:hypothetical protein
MKQLASPLADIRMRTQARRPEIAHKAWSRDRLTVPARTGKPRRGGPRVRELCAGSRKLRLF